YAHSEDVFTLPVNGTGVEGSVDALSLLEMRIRFFIQVIAPENRSVGSGEYLIFIPGIDTVPLLSGHIFFGDQCFVFFQQLLNCTFKITHMDNPKIDTDWFL